MSLVRTAPVLLALAGCWREAAPRPPQPVANESAAVRLRAADMGGVALLATSALEDGGVIVVATSSTGVKLGGAILCKPPESTIAVRFDAAGGVRWTRCAASERDRRIVAAADEASVWIARIVDPEVAEHVHDHYRDLIVADHVRSSDGALLGSRVVSVFDDHAPIRNIADSSARNAAENMKLGAATIANGELLLAGSSKTGSIVDGQWRVPDSYITLHGFVLGVPAEGPVRSVFDTSGAVIEDVSAANGRYAASGWCSMSTQSTVPPRIACGSGGTTAFTVTGDLAGAVPPTTYSFGQDIYEMRSSIADDGSVAIAATSWRSGIDVGPRTINSKCAKFAFVAAFSPNGTSRFARALGDCAQPVPSPYAHDGVSVAESDDQISDHTFGIHDVVFVRGAPVVVVGVGEEMNHLDWPVRFDGLKLSVPFASSAALLVLDPASGAITDHRVLRFLGPSENPRDPDASLASNAGVHELRVTAGAHPWLVIEHGGGLVVGSARYLLRAQIPRRPEWDREETTCDPRTITHAPRMADLLELIQEGGGEPEDFGCRRAVVAETAIEAIRL